MARPRRDGPRLPCGRLRKQLPDSVVEAKEQRRWRVKDVEADADLLAIRLVTTPDEFARWIAADYDMNALSVEVRKYLDQDRALRADAKRWGGGKPSCCRCARSCSARMWPRRASRCRRPPVT
jgi:hypothetical protein